jgi:Ca2+-binding RTX toxin-like protein
LNGDAGNNRIEGGLGDDTLSGRSGNDSFVFRFDGITSQGSGQDIIADFTAGAGITDVISLLGFGASLDSFAEVLAIATDTATGVRIQLTSTDHIDLNGLIKAQLVADDFLFG